jgi:hypothetical protein
MAGSDFRVEWSSKKTGRAALCLGFRERGVGQRLLDQIPQHDLLAEKRTIQGIDVQIIDKPILPTVAWMLSERSLCVSLGRGVMEKVLEPAGIDPAREAGTELAAVGIAPARIADLPASLAQLGALVTGSSPDRLRSYAANVARRLSRYDYGRLRLAIDGKSLVLTGRMRLH